MRASHIGVAVAALLFSPAKAIAVSADLQPDQDRRRPRAHRSAPRLRWCPATTSRARLANGSSSRLSQRSPTPRALRVAPAAAARARRMHRIRRRQAKVCRSLERGAHLRARASSPSAPPQSHEAIPPAHRSHRPAIVALAIASGSSPGFTGICTSSTTGVRYPIRCFAGRRAHAGDHRRARPPGVRPMPRSRWPTRAPAGRRAREIAPGRRRGPMPILPAGECGISDRAARRRSRLALRIGTPRWAVPAVPRRADARARSALHRGD